MYGALDGWMEAVGVCMCGLRVLSRHCPFADAGRGFDRGSIDRTRISGQRHCQIKRIARLCLPSYVRHCLHSLPFPSFMSRFPPLSTPIFCTGYGAHSSYTLLVASPSLPPHLRSISNTDAEYLIPQEERSARREQNKRPTNTTPYRTEHISLH